MKGNALIEEARKVQPGESGNLKYTISVFVIEKTQYKISQISF